MVENDNGASCPIIADIKSPTESMIEMLISDHKES